MKRWKLFIPLVVFFVMGGMLFKGLSLDPNDLPSVLIDKPMPEFSLPSLHDQTVLLDQNVLKGQSYLLNIWGTWCPSCRYEHPYLVELSKMGIPIVGINWRDDADAAKALLKKTGDPYTQNIFDEEGVLAMALGVTGAPETFIVDAEGVIRYKRTGVVNEEIWTSTMAPIFNGQN